MIWNIALVAIGGFIGAMSRYLFSQFFSNRFPSSFPYGTLIVNGLGSFALGWMVGIEAQDVYLLLFGIGFLGAFTTFSTINLEIVILAAEKKRKHLIMYITMTYIVGITAAFLGFMAGA